MTKPRETFYFNPPLSIEGSWMIGLEVFNSLFNISEENNKFEPLNFLMKKVVVFHMKKSEMRLEETWMFRILQLPSYKMK